MKIVVAEKVSAAAVSLLKEEARWHVVTPEQINGDLPAQLADADALIVRSAVQVGGELLGHAKKLRVIGRAGVGVDNIDLDAATKHGIAVMNTPGANAVAVAEHTLALMLALARQLCRADQTTKAGKWDKKSLQGSELRGKTLGIVGFGRIGIEVARRAKVFEMELIAHDPFVPASVAREMGVKLASLEEVLAAGDYITLHMALTPQTANLINAGSLSKMKPGARLINCARGELVDEAALAEALRSKKLGGAALDVFAEEPVRSSPLAAFDNVILTPHIAGSTHEAQDAVGVQIAAQVKEYLKRGVITNAVNVPSVTLEEYQEMQPYIALAERLGSFLAQLGEGRLEEISIRYSGRIAEMKTELLRNAAVQGVLNQTISEKANLVNAASIADERGIHVGEIRKARTPGGGAANVISVFLKTDADERLAKGAVLHGKFPRLLAVNDIDIEAPLEKDLVFMRNRDVPGVIGRVGTVLGEHKINIANFSLGRGEGTAGREALAVVHVDGRVPEAVLAELRKIEAVRVAKAIRLGGDTAHPKKTRALA